MSYELQLRSLPSPTFDAIRKIASQQLAHLTKEQRDKLWRELERGTALLQTHEQMCQYLFSYGNMHKAKLLDAFEKLPLSAFNTSFEIIDWGCGQAMGTINLIDYLTTINLKSKIKKITLIEPSIVALERARIHVDAVKDESVELVARADYFENIVPQDIASSKGRNVIHVFSNILDVEQIDLKHLANLIDGNVTSDNYLVCVGPLNPTNQRIDAFSRYFDIEMVQNIFDYEKQIILHPLFILSYCVLQQRQLT